MELSGLCRPLIWTAMYRSPVFVGAALSILLAHGAVAQALVVRAIDRTGSGAVVGAMVYLSESSDGRVVPVRSALTDDRGEASFAGVVPGRYRVRVEMIGMSTRETSTFDVGEGDIRRTVTLEARPISIAGLDVLADDRCRTRPQQGLLTERLWTEARKALRTVAFTTDEGRYRYSTMTFERDLDRSASVVLHEEQARREGYMRTPFESKPVEDLMSGGFVQASRNELEYFAPDADVLLSDAFLDSHCFRVGVPEPGSAADGLIGLAFEPLEPGRVIDISGTLWLDPETSRLQWLQFRYVGLDSRINTDEVGGRVSFRQLANGAWIVPDWTIRMPRESRKPGQYGMIERFVEGYHDSGGYVLEVVEAGEPSAGARTGTGAVEGTVLDSLGMPLPGVTVTITGSNQQVFTNSEGRFSITRLGAGIHSVQIAYGPFDRLGYRPRLVSTAVSRGRTSSIEHRMPAVSAVLGDICQGDAHASHDVGVLVGRVEESGDGTGLPGTVVRVEWTEYTLTSPGGTVTAGRRTTRRLTTAGEDGFYRVCGVPEDQTLVVVALFKEDEEIAAGTVRIPRGATVAVLDVRVPPRY